MATQPTMLIGLQENASPMANVAVINAVLGKMNENQVMEKSIRLGPMADQWAALAMMKKNIANLDRTNQHSQRKSIE
jgi:hypothetical protein